MDDDRIRFITGVIDVDTPDAKVLPGSDSADSGLIVEALVPTPATADPATKIQQQDCILFDDEPTPFNLPPSPIRLQHPLSLLTKESSLTVDDGDGCAIAVDIAANESTTVATEGASTKDPGDFVESNRNTKRAATPSTSSGGSKKQKRNSSGKKNAIEHNAKKSDSFQQVINKSTLFNWLRIEGNAFYDKVVDTGGEQIRKLGSNLKLSIMTKLRTGSLPSLQQCLPSLNARGV
jgi:hypothetical protein